jgi:hypothetical protein
LAASALQVGDDVQRLDLLGAHDAWYLRAASPDSCAMP